MYHHPCVLCHFLWIPLPPPPPSETVQGNVKLTVYHQCEFNICHFLPTSFLLTIWFGKKATLKNVQLLTFSTQKGHELTVLFSLTSVPPNHQVSRKVQQFCLVPGKQFTGKQTCKVQKRNKEWQVQLNTEYNVQTESQCFE